MTDPDNFPIESPLTQSVTREGKTVQIDIYENGQGAWILEVIDEHGNSTVWDDPFATDADALAEAFRTIEEEGIDSVVGPPSAQPTSAGLDQALADDELDELDDFLANETIQDRSMDVATLEGFLTAIAIGPRFVPPSEWLPWVWDMDEGKEDANFDDADEASRILSLIMRHYNEVTSTFNTDPASFEPIFWRDKHRGAVEWCEGFILGFQFSDEAWSLLAAGQPTWFAPFLRLGTDEGIDLTARLGDTEACMNDIESSLVRIHRYWKETGSSQKPEVVHQDWSAGRQQAFEQVVRAGPKIGRNDPCPCGSGKKFKKCCGADGAPPSLH
jgi:uncharacterized protein